MVLIINVKHVLVLVVIVKVAHQIVLVVYLRKYFMEMIAARLLVQVNILMLVVFVKPVIIVIIV